MIFMFAKYIRYDMKYILPFCIAVNKMWNELN